ncbi:MAG TPA: GNAT family N-acetyltransferase [Chloroflexia bacterium]|nr:GNAT family N-acetyltransferase [Chloroflexia bacterium]
MQTMSFIFKHATEEDASAVHALIQLAFGEYVGMLAVPPGALNDTLEDTLAAVREGHTILLSVDDPDGEGNGSSNGNTKLVGTARYEMRPEYLYVGRVAVHPDYRRQGIGAMLMRHIEGLAPDLGYGRLYLGTRASMPGNVAFYEQLGYTVVKQEPHPRGPDLNVWFEKVLA